MKILLIVLNMIGQGTYWRAFHLGKQLGRKSHDVTLIATSRNRKFGVQENVHQDIRLIEVPDIFSGSMRSGWDLWNTLNRIIWINGRNFDVVHAFESRPTVIFPALFATRGTHTPLIMDWADWFGKGGSVEERTNKYIRSTLRPVETFFENRFRTRATGSTVICTKLMEKAISLGVSTDTIQLLPNGSDTEHILPGEKMRSRERFKLSSDEFIIGYVGSIFWRDAQLLAESFNQVVNQIPDSRLLMIGNNKLDISKFVTKPEKVVQTGYVNQSNLNEYLATCDIFWLPLSNSDANKGRFPLKLNDYLAAGRPIIATSVGDIPSVFKYGEIGFLCSPQAEEFARKTIELYKNRSDWQALGNNSRQLAETHFSWEHISNRLEDFYLTVNS